jgi:hypothetical protein
MSERRELAVGGGELPDGMVERFARTKMIDCFDCGQPYPGEHGHVGPHLICPMRSPYSQPDTPVRRPYDPGVEDPQ